MADTAHIPTIASRPSFGSSLLRWGAIVFACSVPGLFFSVGNKFNPAGVILGIAFFALAYAVVFSTDFMTQFTVQPFVRTSIRVGFGLKLALVILAPFGWFVDVIVGMIAIEAAAMLGLHSARPIAINPTASSLFVTLVITIIHGLILNAMIWFVVLATWRFQKLACTPPRPPDGFCLRCGYDLRGSPERCPECGEAVRNDPLANRLLEA